MEHILHYFEGEKLQCILGMVMALAFIGLSAYFLFLEMPLLKGAAYTFLPLSFFLLIICVSVTLRTPGDIERVTGYYETEQAKMQTQELPRMEKVMQSFSIIKKVEIGFLVTGVLILGVFWNEELIRGVAFGLIVQGVLLYLFDHFAEARGESYLEFLRSLG